MAGDHDFLTLPVPVRCLHDFAGRVRVTLQACPGDGRAILEGFEEKKRMIGMRRVLRHFFPGTRLLPGFLSGITGIDLHACQGQQQNLQR